MPYFLLRQDLFGEATDLEIVGHTELSSRFPWLDGNAFPEPFPRETFVLDDTGGTSWPDFFDTTVPVMSSQLTEHLRAAGVSNLDAYPVVLANPRDGSERGDYAAVNVVGRIDAVDWAASTHELRRGKRRLTGGFVIDERLVGELRAFRLPVGPGFIVVDHTVADALRRATLTSVLLQPTTDYDNV